MNYCTTINTININQMTNTYAPKLVQLNKLIRDEINIIENGGKLSSFKRQIKPREIQLRNQLKQIIKSIAANGQIPGEWVDIRNYFIIMIRDLLESYNMKYNDSKTFEEEKEVILQYFVFFQKAPFTIQRIAELVNTPEKFYKSTKKILYAFQKLVNVNDPQQR